MFIPAFPAPSAASSPALHPSLPPLAKARSFRGSSFPHRTRCAGLRRGPLKRRLAHSVFLTPAFPAPPAASSPALHPSLPPLAKARSFRGSSFPHRTRCAGLRRGPLKQRLAHSVFLTPAFPAPPARDSSSRQTASASRPGGTGPRSPPWGRRGRSCA